MKKAGFIGYGSMGSMLVTGFIKTGALAPDDIIVSTRTKSKLDPVMETWPQLTVARDNKEAAEQAQYLFVCVEPAEVKEILTEIRDALHAGSIIVSIAGSVSMKNIENVTGGKVIRLIPSLTSEVNEGISLVDYNALISPEEAACFEALMGRLGAVKRIPENEFGLATVLTSCGPGLFAAMLAELTSAALRQGSTLDGEDVRDMVMRTFYGTAKVLLDKNMGFDEMVQRVATRGGITEEGAKALRAGLPETFDQMFEATLAKRDKACRQIDEDFNI